VTGALAVVLGFGARAAAQQQPYPQAYPPPGYSQPYPPGYPQSPPPGYAPAPVAQPASRAASGFELGTLYAASAAYGIGLGIWLDSEIGLEDPGLLLIAPAVLGIAAPVGAFFLDKPSMPRGKPSAIAAGLALGAAEGLGIAGTQFVASDKSEAWGFRGLARSVAIGATVGGVGGYLIGDLQNPSPKLSAMVASSALWGTLIGGSIGYGASAAGIGYGHANDSGAVGGLTGFNVGLLAGIGISLLAVPSYKQIAGMWEGAGIGAAASLPVFLFYTRDDGPPAKRGLIFSGVAMTLGIAAGAIFASPDDGPSGSATDTPAAAGVAAITGITPFTTPGDKGAGLAVTGILY
jgi:hypothetical protein